MKNVLIVDVELGLVRLLLHIISKPHAATNVNVISVKLTTASRIRQLETAVFYNVRSRTT